MGKELVLLRPENNCFVLNNGDCIGASCIHDMPFSEVASYLRARGITLTWEVVPNEASNV